MAGDQEFAIETAGLRKQYGKVIALDGVDLRVERGIVLRPARAERRGQDDGGADPDDAAASPTRAAASVAGIDVLRHPAQVREKIGLAGQYAAVDDNLTGAENLEMVGRLYHLGGGNARERARELLEEFELSYAGGRLVRTYSGGMRQAARPRGGDGRAPGGAVPRRADDRHRPAQQDRARGDDRGPGRARGDGAADDAVPRRGRPARRAARGHRRRTRDRGRHAGRAEGPEAAANGSKFG